MNLGEKQMNLLDGLNSEQIKPILDTEGAVLVIAGAGSGKTATLTERISRRIIDGADISENDYTYCFTVEFE